MQTPFCQNNGILMSDLILSNPRLEEADILVATDGLGVANAKDDDGLESPEAGLRSQMSTGILPPCSFMHFLPSWIKGASSAALLMPLAYGCVLTTW